MTPEQRRAEMLADLTTHRTRKPSAPRPRRNDEKARVLMTRYVLGDPVAGILEALDWTPAAARQALRRRGGDPALIEAVKAVEREAEAEARKAGERQERHPRRSRIEILLDKRIATLTGVGSFAARERAAELRLLKAQITQTQKKDHAA